MTQGTGPTRPQLGQYWVGSGQLKALLVRGQTMPVRLRLIAWLSTSSAPRFPGM